MKELSKKIRLLRHQRTWSQEDVANRLHISIPAYSKIETGITDVNISRLGELADIFELSLVQLLTFDDSKEQETQSSVIEELSAKLHSREIEIIDMQKKIIDLYEELRSLKV